MNKVAITGWNELNPAEPTYALVADVDLVVFKFGVTYQTPRDKLKKIPTMVRETIEEQDKVRFDRAHFQSYGTSSLDFEVVYYVLSPDYNQYMDIQQAVNLGIHERFEQEDISFAYPTQTVYVHQVGDEQ